MLMLAASVTPTLTKVLSSVGVFTQISLLCVALYGAIFHYPLALFLKISIYFRSRSVPPLPKPQTAGSFLVPHMTLMGEKINAGLCWGKLKESEYLEDLA